VIHRTPFFLPLLYSSLTWRIGTAGKELYLTFDDGPVPGPTEFVLETLDRLKAKATFFCIGDNVRKHPEVFRKILRDGHVVGNHTFNHLNGWKTSSDDYVKNVQQCDEVMNSHVDGQQPSRLFRPPYGRITRQQIKAMAGYRIIMWDVLSVDYSKGLLPEACLRNTINASRPGSIIVFHDSLKAERNMTYALPRLIEHFSEKGFVFKSLAS
jgi:peptidoglycan/xylan/chitin deacetylase (PgdA/CDA1 family)